MTRLKQVVVAVTVTLLIPSLGQARTEYDNIRSAKSILGPLSSLKLPGSTDPGDAEVLAKFDELEKKLELSAAEKKWFGIVRKKREELDKAKTRETLPELFARQKAQEKEEKRKAFAAAFPMLQQIPPANINPSRLRSSEEACPANFSTSMQLAQALQSDLVQSVVSNGKKYATASKEEKAQLVAQLKDEGKKFKQRVRDKRKAEKEKSLLASEKRDFKSSSIPKLKAGVDGLKDLADELDSETDRRTFALADEIFGKLLPAQLEEEKEQAEIQQLVASIQARLEPQRQQAFTQASQSAIDLHDACTSMRDEMLSGNPKTGQPPLTYTIKEITASQNPKDPQIVAQYSQTIDTVAADLKCPRTAEDAINTAVGEPMRAKIASLAGVPDANTLVQSVIGLIPQMTQLIGDAEQPLNDAINACVAVAEQKKAFEQMIAQGQQAAAGPAQARLNSQRGQNLGGQQASASGQQQAFPTHQPR